MVELNVIVASLVVLSPSIVTSPVIYAAPVTVRSAPALSASVMLPPKVTPSAAVRAMAPI